MGDKILQDLDYKAYIEAIGNDLKIAIDDLIKVVSLIQDDMDKLKAKTTMSNKDITSDS